MSPRRGLWVGLALGALTGQVSPVNAADTADPSPADVNVSVDDFVRDHGKDALILVLAQSLAECDKAGTKALFATTGRPIVVNREAQHARYPQQEVNHGHQAVVIVSFLVDAFGNARFVHVDSVVSSDKEPIAFGKHAIEEIREMGFVPGTEAGAPVAGWKSLRISYVIRTYGPLGSIFNAEKLHSMVAAARHG